MMIGTQESLESQKEYFVGTFKCKTLTFLNVPYLIKILVVLQIRTPPFQYTLHYTKLDLSSLGFSPEHDVEVTLILYSGSVLCIIMCLLNIYKYKCINS